MGEFFKPANEFSNKQNEEQLVNLFLQAPVGFSLVKGSDHVMELANKEFLRLTGRGEEIIGKRIIEIFTEIETQGYLPLLNRVLNNKETIHLNEKPAVILIDGVRQTFYMNTIFQPFFNGDEAVGVMSILTDVTEQVVARKKIEESEYRFKLALRGSTHIVFSQDKNLKHNWIYNSHPAFNADSIIGKDDAELHEPQTAQRLTAIKKSVIESGESIRTEVLMNINSEQKFYDLLVEPLKNKNDEVEGITGVAIDITESVIARNKINESEELFRNLANSIPQLAWITDAEGSIYWYNQRWYDYTGTTFEQMKGWGWQSVHHPDLLNDVTERFKKALAIGEPYEQIFLLRSKEGEYRWFLTRAVPVRNEKDEIVKWFGSNTDVTDQRNIEVALKNTKAQLELTFQNVPADIFLFDKTGAMIFANDKAAQFMGYQSADELLKEKDLNVIRNRGEELFETFEEDGSKRVVETSPLVVAFKTGKSAEGIYSVRYKKDGKIKWRFNTATPLLDENGEINMVLVSTIDITTQKEAEKLIRQSEEKFRTLAETLPQLIWITSQSGEQEYASPRWKEYSGIDPIGFETWQQMVHPDDILIISAAWQKSILTGDIYKSEARLKDKNGEYRWHAVQGEPIKDESGKIIKWIGAFTDIDEQKKAIQQKADFLSIASHELKTPVTSIKAFTQILQMKFEKDGNSEASDMVKRMHKQVDKLTSLIIDLLDATKVENGQLKFFIEDFDFNNLVKDTVEEMQRTTQTHKIIFELSNAVIVEGDKNKIGQVITNLLSNAIKYSPKAGEIIVSTHNEKNKVKLCVHDFGIGIAKEKQSQVFERFFRVSGDKEDTFPGLGLGLYIAAAIIKRHKGKISLESEEDKGSTFCFTLPLVNKGS